MQYTGGQIIDSFEQLGKAEPDKILVIKLSDKQLTDKKEKKTFLRSVIYLLLLVNCKLNAYKNTEYLIISNLCLKKKVTEISMPHARYIDISKNNIQDLTPILQFFKNSPNLEVAVVSDNPAMSKPNARERVLI